MSKAYRSAGWLHNKVCVTSPKKCATSGCIGLRTDKKLILYGQNGGCGDHFISLLPPMYMRSGSGMEIVPSAFKLFSRNAISVRGGATTVLFNVCAK